MKIFNRQGEPIDEDTYVTLWTDRDYKTLKQTSVGPYLVSTVWLGLDHNYGQCDEPLIFETMVFYGADREDLELERYSTEDQALKGHEAMCDKYKGGSS